MAKNNDSQVSAVRRAKHGWVLTTFFSALAVLWLYPIFLVAINAIKKKAFITRNPFALPDDRSYFGFANFVNGIDKTNFWSSAEHEHRKSGSKSKVNNNDTNWVC